MDTPGPDLGDVALALGAAAFDALRMPLGLTARLPGVRMLARDGALVRERVRSRIDGLACRALETPEIARATDEFVRRIAAQLRDAERPTTATSLKGGLSAGAPYGASGTAP